jgi:hypothetical protein
MIPNEGKYHMKDLSTTGTIVMGSGNGTEIEENENGGSPCGPIAGSVRLRASFLLLQQFLALC